MQTPALFVDPRLGALHAGGRPVRLWPVLASGCLGVAAVGLLAAAAPQLMNNPPQQPVRSGAAMWSPLPVQPSKLAPGLTAEALLQAAPHLQTAAVQPQPSERAAALPAGGAAAPNTMAELTRLVGLNTGSQQALSALPGIGRSRARAIIRGRPYNSVAELAERRIVPARAYKAVRTRVDLR
ncbi:ComEA family DNA-binding protein [Methylorubrum extorquens]